MSAISGLRPRLLGAVAVIAVVALIALLAFRPWSSSDIQQLASSVGPGDRVLQSVAVTMQPDGSLSNIDDTLVVSRKGGEKSTSARDTYTPAKVADDLPVRVLTSWRTDKKTGTDLADLKGYTGRVTIDLNVENLTVSPERLSYDVAGSSRQATAMVGVPLTVTAATTLGHTDAAAVLTRDNADDTGDAQVTNGVISQADKDATRVQWATILAPPQLGSSANLRLVLDAKDFDPPSFDLSVQPGLVTDPSLGALVDAAFNPAGSDNLQLQARTIALIGDVNGVLARASQTITGVRDTLESTSQTLGAKTVADLKSSTAQVASSMKSFDSTLKALDGQLQQSIKSTQSTMLSTLDDTVRRLNDMLGDTSAQAPKAALSGSGCATTVAAPQQQDSLYANLLQVVAQLDGYATATDACKVQLTQTILDTIGPKDPTAASCTGSSSVTCSLLGIQSTFIAVADQMIKDGETALDSLDLRKSDIDDAVTELQTLSQELDTVMSDVTVLINKHPVNATQTILRGILDDDIPNVTDSIDAIASIVKDVHAQALAGSDKLDSMIQQNDDVASMLCTYVADPANPQPNTLSDKDIEDMRRYLVDDSCPASDGTTTPLHAPFKYESKSLHQRLLDRKADFDAIATATDVKDTSQGLGQALTTLRANVDVVKGHVQDAINQLYADSKDLQDAIKQLDDSMAAAQDTFYKLTSGVNNIKGSWDQTIDDARTAFEQAGQAAKDSVASQIQPQIQSIYSQGQADSDLVAQMFANSVNGLTSAATSIQTNTRKQVDGQRDAFVAAQNSARSDINTEVTRALGLIASGVTSSTSDLTAARTLLTNDLTDVLLDLGTRQVRGSGLLGAMATGAATAKTADYQLALATDKASSYAEVRGHDIAGIQLRQAQAEASLRRQADLSPFVITVPQGTDYAGVYLFRIQGSK